VFIAEHNQGHHSVYCFALPSAARFLQDFRVLYHLISGVCVKFSKSCGVLEISIDWTDAKFPTGKFRHNKAVTREKKQIKVSSKHGGQKIPGICNHGERVFCSLISCFLRKFSGWHLPQKTFVNDDRNIDEIL
jgi:hypothetical protein